MALGIAKHHSHTSPDKLAYVASALVGFVVRTSVLEPSATSWRAGRMGARTSPETGRRALHLREMGAWCTSVRLACILVGAALSACSLAPEAPPAVVVPVAPLPPPRPHFAHVRPGYTAPARRQPTKSDDTSPPRRIRVRPRISIRPTIAPEIPKPPPPETPLTPMIPTPNGAMKPPSIGAWDAPIPGAAPVRAGSWATSP